MYILNIILNKFNIIVSSYYYLCRIFCTIQLKKIASVKIKYRIIFFSYEIWFLKKIDFKYSPRLYFYLNPILNYFDFDLK